MNDRTIYVTTEDQRRLSGLLAASGHLEGSGKANLRDLSEELGRRPAGPAEPMDPLFLAEGLTQALGTAIPEPFRVEGSPGLERRRLAHPGRNRERLSMLHTAFAIQLLAYEEHLL